MKRRDLERHLREHGCQPAGGTGRVERVELRIGIRQCTDDPRLKLICGAEDHLALVDEVIEERPLGEARARGRGGR